MSMEISDDLGLRVEITNGRNGMWYYADQGATFPLLGIETDSSHPPCYVVKVNRRESRDDYLGNERDHVNLRDGRLVVQPASSITLTSPQVRAIQTAVRNGRTDAGRLALSGLETIANIVDGEVKSGT